MIRSHLEYANCGWSPTHRTLFKILKNVEKVQIRATKLIKEVKDLSYIERLKYLYLPTLQYRRFRGDMIMVYKLLSGIYDSNIACQLVKPTNVITRGHHLRLFKGHVHYDIRKYYFGNHIISHWNSLPDTVINSNFIGVFENRLDLFRKNQECYFNYKSDLGGRGPTGSRSQL
jgi:ribonuclease P/MRP protein subunit RPP40